MNTWNIFLVELQKDISLWLFCVLFLSTFRLALILYFKELIDSSSRWTDILKVMTIGVRFDVMIASYTALIPFLFSIICNFSDLRHVADLIRDISWITFIVVSSIICVITISYFKEYKDQLNYFAFGLYYDDTEAILTTIWKEYHPVLNLAATGIIIFLSIAVKSHLSECLPMFYQASASGPALPFRILAVLASGTILFLGMRGSLGRRPAQRHDASVSRDEFLNKTVFNPYLSLRYAIKDHMRLSGSRGLSFYLPDEDIVKAAKSYFSTDRIFSSLDEYMCKYADGRNNTPARHVFIIVMESYDAWPMLDKYSSLGLSERLKDLATRGLHVKSYLPSSTGTMQSFAAIVTGLTDAGIQTNLRQNTEGPYPTSLAEGFKRMEYRTRFFYGGRLSWRRVDEFCRSQGFEEIYGASHMGSWMDTNEWGVADENLFDFIRKTVNDERPSLNLILTTGYHPPFSVDVYGKGFPLHKVPEDMVPQFDKSVDLKTLGHLWYSDQSLGNFIGETEKTLKRPLFIVTGDHYGRRFINPNPDTFERSAVPLVLYGKDVLNWAVLPDGAAGSHIDIGPTAIELCAEKGFQYYSIGQDLLSPHQRSLGFGKGLVIGEDFIADVSGIPAIYPIPGRSPSKRQPDGSQLKEIYNAVNGISWWRIRMGAEI